MTNLTFAQEILEMFTMADKDEDGKINYEEFLIMITPRKVAIQLFLQPIFLRVWSYFGFMNDHWDIISYEDDAINPILLN